MPKEKQLRLVRTNEPTEKVFGSRAFIALDRNPALKSPAKFEPTKKAPGDVTI